MMLNSFSIRRLMLAAALALLASASTTLAQTTFFMAFNGRVSAGGGVTPRAGDMVIVRTTGGTAQASLDASGQYTGVVLSKGNNDATPVFFDLRQGAVTYNLVLAAGDTTPHSVPYLGANNPLSAAFNALTVNVFVGPRASGGNEPPGEEPEVDPLDVDGNGIIELADAQIVMRFIVGDREGVNDVEAMDSSGDGRISTDDVVLILRNLGQPSSVAPAPTGGT